MPLVILALAALAGFTRLLWRLNGRSFRHIDTPPSWGDGGVGDDWYRRNP